MNKIMESFIITFIVYTVGIILLKVVAYFTNWYHVSDLVYCFAFILGDIKVLVEEYYE